MNNWKTIIEVLLFVSSKPLSIKKIVNITGKKTDEVRKIINNLQEDYRINNRPFFIQEISGGFSFATRPEFSTWVNKLYNSDRKISLSVPSVETLAIIAYNQPITRLEIETIRGVDSSSVLTNLLKNGFIRIRGRKKTPGNPFLYRVTEKFLLHFGLKSVSDLPPLEELEIEDGKNEAT